MSVYNNERIFDIFISSTERDLKEQRISAIDVVSELGHRPIAMERFDPGFISSKEYIDDCIKNCDFFVLILGRTFGTNAEDNSGNKEAFVTWEYNTAKKYEKNIVAFVLDDIEIESSELPETVLQFRNELLTSGQIRGFYCFNDLPKFRGWNSHNPEVGLGLNCLMIMSSAQKFHQRL